LIQRLQLLLELSSIIEFEKVGLGRALNTIGDVLFGLGLDVTLTNLRGLALALPHGALTLAASLLHGGLMLSLRVYSLCLFWVSS
jgi:hypothetical protein